MIREQRVNETARITRINLITIQMNKSVQWKVASNKMTSSLWYCGLNNGGFNNK